MEAGAARRRWIRGTLGRACQSAGPRSGTRSSLLRTVSDIIIISAMCPCNVCILQLISQEGAKPFLLS